MCSAHHDALDDVDPQRWSERAAGPGHRVVHPDAAEQVVGGGQFGAVPGPFAERGRLPDEFDVVVVGAGAAGMVGALTAARAGPMVGMLEKQAGVAAQQSPARFTALLS